MRKLFQIAILALFVLIVSCGGGGKDPKDSCPDGYEWSGTDCVKKGSVIDGGDSGTADTGTQTDDGDTADDSGNSDGDENDDSDNTDSGTSDYHGSCKIVRSGDSFEINVETKKLTVGAVTVKGATDLTNVYGELWGKNESTLSEFKIADIDSKLAGKTFELPKGKYEFSYKPVYKSGEKTVSGSAIPFVDSNGKKLENIDMSTGDKTLDFDVPLYHFKGKVLGSGGTDFTAADEVEPELTVSSGSFEKVIPYSEFAAYDILLPKGTYSVYFKGRLVAGVDFEGTVLSGVVSSNNSGDSGDAGEGESEESASETSDGAIQIEGDSATIEKNIEIKTIRFAGSIVIAGDDAVDVKSGRLILVENPPLGSVNAVVVADLSADGATAYDVTVTAGATFNLLYLPETDSYPKQFIKLETWSAATENPGAHNISLDFAKVHGTITFLGGNNFPTVSKCVPKECQEGAENNCVVRECSIGKLKVQGYSSSGDSEEVTSYLIKDLGSQMPTDEEGNAVSVTYTALLPRRFMTTDVNGNSTFVSKTYTMVFESHLNDVAEIFDGNPFTVSTGVSFSFSKTEADESIVWLSDKTLDVNIAPSKVSGKITLNEQPVDITSPDLVKLKGSDGIEQTVAVLSELSKGEFSFYAPKGTYDVIYSGKGILQKDFKTYIERDFEIKGDTNKDFEIKTGKITLDFKVNGTPFAQWAAEHKALKFGLAVNIDKLTNDFLFDFMEKDEKYVSEVILGSTVNASLEIAFDDKVDSEKSYVKIPLLNQHNLTSGKTVTTDMTLVGFSLSVKLNGTDVTASKYAAKLKLPGTHQAEIYCPATSAVAVFLPEKEYKSPTPGLSLNEGFGTKQEITVPCMYFDK